MSVQDSETARGRHTFRSRGFWIALFTLSVGSSCGLGFSARTQRLERGTDSSYLFAANRASEEGLRFGEEFISTFGPYCYLIYASDIGRAPRRKIVGELVLVFLVGLAAASFVAIHPSLGNGIALGVALVLLYAVHLQGNSIYGDEYRWFSLLLLLVVTAVRAGPALGHVTFLLASLLGGFFLLVKLSLGAGAVLTLGAACAITRRPLVTVQRLGILIAGVAVGFTAAWLSHQSTLAGIQGFFGAAADVVSGYGSAMSLSPEGWERVALCFGAFAALTTVIVAVSDRALSLTTWLACGAPLFVSWKHAMVRQDTTHVRSLVLFGFFTLCVVLVPLVARRRYASALSLLVPVGVLLAPWFLQGDSLAYLRERVAAPLRFPGRNVVQRVGSLTVNEGAAARKPTRELEELRLRRRIRSRIGASTIDVYPWENVYVPANDLNWRHRPSPSSFATYSAGLDRRNSRFFSSSQKPEYLLWDLAPGVFSIDRRHLFWDEPETLRAILDSYRVVVDGNVLLLRRSDPGRLGAPRLVRVVETTWGEWTAVPPVAGVLFAAFGFERPLSIRLRALWLREDPMYLSVRFATGGEQTFRFVPAQARSGLWMSPLPRNRSELRAVMSGQLTPAPTSAFRIHGAWGDERRPKVVVSWLASAAAPPSESVPRH